jgi:DNA-binding MurR/RpiR family transcriptional regulator
MMTNTERVIANYILKDTDKFVKSNIHVMADTLNISSASISKFVRKYCKISFGELKIEVASGSDNDAYNSANEIFNWADSFNEMPDNIIRSISKTCKDVIDVNGIEPFKQAIECINNAHTVYFFGVGSSGIIVMDFMQKLIRLKKLCVYNIDSNFGVLNSKISTEKDVIIAISFSGKSKEVNLAVKEAKKNGTKCIAITRNSRSELETLADLKLLVPSTELNATRLAPIFSRYGQLFIVDMLFLGLAKQKTNSVDEFMDQYQILLSKLK